MLGQVPAILVIQVSTKVSASDSTMFEKNNNKGGQEPPRLRPTFLCTNENLDCKNNEINFKSKSN